MRSSTRRRSGTVWAPATRFSSAVRCSNTRRPSKTWTIPRCTIRCGGRSSIRWRRAGPAPGGGREELLLGARLLDVLGDDVLIRREPVRHLDELTVLHLPDLHEPAALVILRRDLERRHETAEREVRDLLEAL